MPVFGFSGVVGIAALPRMGSAISSWGGARAVPQATLECTVGARTGDKDAGEDGSAACPSGRNFLLMWIPRALRALPALPWAGILLAFSQLFSTDSLDGGD